MHPAKALRFDCAFRKHIFDLSFELLVAVRPLSNGLNGLSNNVLILIFIHLQGLPQGRLYPVDKSSAIVKPRQCKLMIATDVKVSGHFQRFLEQVERSNSLSQCRSALRTQGAELCDVLSGFHEGGARSIYAGSFERKNARCFADPSHFYVVVHEFDCLQSSDQGLCFRPAQSGEYCFIDIILLVAPGSFSQTQPHSGAGSGSGPDSGGPVSRRRIRNKTPERGGQYRGDYYHNGYRAKRDGPAAPVEPFPNRFVHRGFLPSWWVEASYSTQWRLSA